MKYTVTIFTCQLCGISFTVETDSKIDEHKYCSECKYKPKKEKKQMKIRIGVLKYHCLKCGNHQTLELRPIMSDATAKLFADMFDVKLCGNCFLDSKIPELVECLLH